MKKRITLVIYFTLLISNLHAEMGVHLLKKKSTYVKQGYKNFKGYNFYPKTRVGNIVSNYDLIAGNRHNEFFFAANHSLFSYNFSDQKNNNKLLQDKSTESEKIIVTEQEIKDTEREMTPTDKELDNAIKDVPVPKLDDVVVPPLDTEVPKLELDESAPTPESTPEASSTSDNVAPQPKVESEEPKPTEKPPSEQPVEEPQPKEDEPKPEPEPSEEEKPNETPNS